MKLLILALCVVSATAFSKRCKSSADCEEDECCVNYVLTPIFGGVCQKLRQEGDPCTPVIREDKQNPDMHHFQCPCKEGLECVATHQIKIGSVVLKIRPECVVPGEVTTVVEEITTVDGGDEIGNPDAE